MVSTSSAARLVIAVATIAFCVSPAVAQENAAAAAAGRERTLLFAGDVMLSRAVEAKMRAENDWTYPFQKIAPTLRAADLAFANLECPVSDLGRDLKHLYSFRADPQALEGLKAAGFRVMSVANNHSYDWGREALLDTVRRLGEAGIRAVGAGANELEAHYPVVVNLEGVRLAFLAYVGIEPRDAEAGITRPGVAWLDPPRVMADIRFARPLADVVIVSVHWGVEYTARPRPREIKLAREMIGAGADLVVGHHPHVVQPVEKYGRGWIAYSLGNFVFDQRDPPTRRGLILKVTLRGRAIAAVSSIPIEIDKTFRPSVAAEEPSRESQPAAAGATHPRQP